MLDPVQAISVGAMARRALSERLVQGRVIAAFRSTVWIETPAGALCVTLGTIARGPVNIATDVSHGDWRSTGVRVGQAVVATPGWLKFGAIEISTRAASVWNPEPFRAHRLAVGLRKLNACMPPLPLAEGHAAGARAWCLGETKRLGWVKGIIGRGPGLTPAGDDFLGGMLIALHCLGRVDQARRLWSEIRLLATARTNVISFALLSAAAQGQGSAAIHDAINGIGRGDPPETYVAGVDVLGHSSGWDALAGAVTVLESELALA